MMDAVCTGVAYFGCHHLAHVRADLETIAATFDYIILPMSEADLRWSHGTVGAIVAAAQAVGVEVWLDPWGVGGVFGGEALSGFVGEFPDECQHTNDGQRLPRACPTSPHFRAYVHQWIAAAAQTSADGVFWDEPHFWTGAWSGEPERWACCCERCCSRFAQATGQALHNASMERVQRWQADELRTLLFDLTATAHEHRLRNTVCLLPAPEHAAGWAAIAALPHVDTFGTDPYWFTHHQADRRQYVGGWARHLLDVTHNAGRAHQLWLQAFKVPAGGEQQIAEMIDLGIDLGVRNLAFWGYGGCAHMSSLACAEPDTAWRVVTQHLQQLKAQKDVTP